MSPTFTSGQVVRLLEIAQARLRGSELTRDEADTIIAKIRELEESVTICVRPAKPTRHWWDPRP